MQTSHITTLPRVFQSLGFRLFLLFFLIVSGLFTVYTNLCAKYQMRILEDAVRLSAFRSGDVIRKSLHRDMMLNDRKSLYETIQTIGTEPGVDRIRIYNKTGEIKFSTLPLEVGRAADMQAEACNVCHQGIEPYKTLPDEQRARIFRVADTSRVLGLIIPVYNTDECSNGVCHAHSRDKSILGVLDVQMSLQELDLATEQARRQVLGFSAIFIFAGMLVIALVIYYATHRPIQRLMAGTEKLASGDMDYRIVLKREDELGLLAASFNNMAANLKKAYLELKRWSQTLENRVDEKSQELEKMHREMIQVERLASLGRMAATVAHELNNPLAGIVNYAKLSQKKIGRLLQDDPERQKLLDQLEVIRSEALRTGNIVKNLLIFAKGSTVNFQNNHLRDILERALNLVGHHLHMAGVSGELQMQLASDELVCDADQILQAMVALLINAVEAMSGGGELTVRAEDSPELPEALRIVVQDTGVGIPEEIRDQIFDPFYSTKAAAKGVGLGLSVVYGIIQRHKGKIWVESQPGHGSTFFIELPRQMEASMEEI